MCLSFSEKMEYVRNCQAELNTNREAEKQNLAQRNDKEKPYEVLRKAL